MTEKILKSFIFVILKANLLNTEASPVRSIKSVKNSVEIEKTRFCQVKYFQKKKKQAKYIILKKIRDCISRVRHLFWLETELNKGNEVTEISAAKKLEEIQSYLVFKLKLI